MSIKLAMDVKALQQRVGALEAQMLETVKLVADSIEKISALRVEVGEVQESVAKRLKARGQV